MGTVSYYYHEVLSIDHQPVVTACAHLKVRDYQALLGYKTYAGEGNISTFFTEKRGCFSDHSRSDPLEKNSTL